MRRQIINELHIPKVKECVRIGHVLYKRLFFTVFPIPITQWFLPRYSCLLTKKIMLDSFPSYPNNKGENFSYIFEELPQKQFRKN